MWALSKISLSICFILLLSLRAESQTLTYQFIDPCTKVVSFFSVPAQGSTIFFLGNSRSFVPGDVSNGTLAAWINQVYTDYRKITPCSQQSGQVTQNQITSQIIGSTVQSVVGSIMGQAQSAAGQTINNVSMSSTGSSSGGNSDAATKNNKEKESKKDKNEKPKDQGQASNASGPVSGSGQTNSQQSSTSTPNQTNNVSMSSTGSSSGGNSDAATKNNKEKESKKDKNEKPKDQGQASNASGPVSGSGQTNSQQSSTSTPNQTNTPGSPPVISGQSNSQNSGGNGNNSGSVGGGVGGNSESGGKTDQKKESGGEEVAATTTMNIDQQNQNSAKDNGGGGGKGGSKSKSRNNNPLLVSSDFTTAQNLDKTFTPILNLSMSQSSLTGMKSWGTTAMVWFNFKQFALSGKYTKINFSKNGKLKWVHNLNLTGVYTYGNVLAFVGYSGILNAGKFGVTGFNVSGAATLITEDKNTFFSPSITAFYTKPFKANKKLTISPELYIISTPLIYSSKDKITTTDRTFSAFLGSGFDYQLTRRFKLNMNYKANMSTNPDFPILSFFLIGSKINL